MAQSKSAKTKSTQDDGGRVAAERQSAGESSSQGNSSAHTDLSSWKPGSEPEKTKQTEAPGDFGVHASRGSTAERDYTSRNVQVSDHGAAQPWSRENLDGARTAGAGAHDSGVGSSSGGDLDPDLIGVGTGGSTISQSGPSDRRGMDETTGGSEEFASGRPATGSVPENANAFSGSTITEPLPNSPDAFGADAASRPDLRDDDSFKGEISSGEARGEDNEMGREG